jgi:hypothetical protein
VRSRHTKTATAQKGVEAPCTFLALSFSSLSGAQRRSRRLAAALSCFPPPPSLTSSPLLNLGCRVQLSFPPLRFCSTPAALFCFDLAFFFLCANSHVLFSCSLGWACGVIATLHSYILLLLPIFRSLSLSVNLPASVTKKTEAIFFQRMPWDSHP